MPGRYCSLEIETKIHLGPPALWARFFGLDIIYAPNSQ